MAELITVFWRDIPAQVIAKQGRKKVKRMLSQRFQEAVDRAAMRAGKGSSDAYLAEWRRVREKCDGDLDGAVSAAVDSIEQSFSDEKLLQLVRSKGVDEAQSAADS